MKCGFIKRTSRGRVLTTKGIKISRINRWIEQISTTDEEKRGKLLSLAALIALAIFISKITQAQTQIITWRVYLNAGIYFLLHF
jgi:hypothetical protein